MSDQDKPHEWKAVQANDDWAIRTERRHIAVGRGTNSMLAAQEIADAHNAAVKEAYQKGYEDGKAGISAALAKVGK